MTCVTHHLACACREAAHTEEIARLTRELDAARAHRTIAVRERDIALSERDAARADDAMHFEQLRHVYGVLAEARAELKRVKEILASHLERGPLSWVDVGWDSATPDVVRIGLREEGGALHTALIPVEKAALVGATAALAAPPKRSKRAKVERTNRADVRLTPTASSLVAAEGLLRDDVAALLGRASMDGQKRATMTVREGRVAVFMLTSRERGDVFVWSAAVEGGPRG